MDIVQAGNLAMQVHRGSKIKVQLAVSQVLNAHRSELPAGTTVRDICLELSRRRRPRLPSSKPRGKKLVQTAAKKVANFPTSLFQDFTQRALGRI